MARGGGKLYTVAVDAGAAAAAAAALPLPMALPEVFQGCLSPDGRSVAYIELAPPTATWKRYR